MRVRKGVRGAGLGWASQPDSEWSPGPKREQALGSPGGERMFAARQNSSWSHSGKWMRQGVARSMVNERGKASYTDELRNVGRWIGMDVRNKCQPPWQTDGADGKACLNPWFSESKVHCEDLWLPQATGRLPENSLWPCPHPHSRHLGSCWSWLNLGALNFGFVDRIQGRWERNTFIFSLISTWDLSFFWWWV